MAPHTFTRRRNLEYHQQPSNDMFLEGTKKSRKKTPPEELDTHLDTGRTRETPYRRKPELRIEPGAMR